ncbi:MAG: OadG family protein [Ruminococcus sp.]|nr:OadG family protein [Ruminococcus sp.]MBR0303091.1 OadG family protein [Clostridia bacterium]
MAERLTTSLTVLLTGFVVVFAVLLLLIGIIKLYGTIVYRIQTGQKEKSKKEEPVTIKTPPAQTAPAAVIEAEESVDDSELIAVISASVYAMYSDKKVKIKSIRRTPGKSAAWKNAGLSDNIRPF